MPYKNLDKKRATQKRWRDRNKEKINLQRKERRARYQEKANAYAKQYRIDNKEIMAIRNKEWLLKTLSDPEKRRLLKQKQMLNSAKARAIKENVPFNITVEDVVIPDRCPITQVLLWSGSRNTSGSIDRIIPELGYVKENIGVISLGVNRLKSVLKLYELERLVKYVKGEPLDQRGV